MFENKIYNLQNIEGKRNKEITPLIKELDKEFSRHPAHIGIVPRGSSVKGYSIESSDIDLVVLFDSSKVADKAERLYFLDSLRERGIAPMYLDVNPELILSDFALSVESVGFGAVIQRIAALTEMVTGRKVREYREILRGEIARLSKENAQKVKDRVIDLLTEHEKYNVRKMAKRSGKDYDGLLSERIKLWKQRYDRIWSTK